MHEASHNISLIPFLLSRFGGHLVSRGTNLPNENKLFFSKINIFKVVELKKKQFHPINPAKIHAWILYLKNLWSSRLKKAPWGSSGAGKPIYRMKEYIQKITFWQVPWCQEVSKKVKSSFAVLCNQKLEETIWPY